MAGENNLSFEIQVNGIPQVITSVTQANKIIKQLAAEFTGVANSTALATQKIKEVNQVLIAKQNLQAFSRGMMDASGNIGATAVSSRQASMAMLNLNYVIRDSPYFFSNFAMGVMAIGNNLNPLIDSIVRAKKEAQDMGVTFGSLMKKTLLGSSGFIFAMSLAVAAFQAITFAMSKSNREAKEMKKELKELGAELQNLARVELTKTKIKAMMDIAAIEAEVEKNINELLSGKKGTGGVLGVSSQEITAFATDRGKLRDKVITDEQKEQIRQNEEIIAQSKIILNSTTTERIIENEIRYLKERRKDATKEEAIELTKQIASLEKMLDSYTKIDKEKKRNLRKYLDVEERGYRFANEEEEKLFKKRVDFAEKLAENYQRLGLTSTDASQLAFLVSGNLQGDQQTLPRQKEPSQTPTQRVIKQIDKDLEKLEKERLRGIDQVASIAGNAISNAFMQGKNAIEAATAALGQFIIQLLFIQTLKGIFSTVTGGTFSEGFMDGFLGMKGDTKKVSTSAASVGNFSQTGIVLKPVFVFKNTIDSQKIILEGAKQLQSRYR